MKIVEIYRLKGISKKYYGVKRTAFDTYFNDPTLSHE